MEATISVYLRMVYKELCYIQHEYIYIKLEINTKSLKFQLRSEE